MNRHIVCFAAAIAALVAWGGPTFGGGFHHYGHGHHHSGFHIHFGSGYGHHHHYDYSPYHHHHYGYHDYYESYLYPSYGFSNYPSYYGYGFPSYGYSGYRSCYTPTVVQPSVVSDLVSPPYGTRRVEPAPLAIDAEPFTRAQPIATRRPLAESYATSLQREADGHAHVHTNSSPPGVVDSSETNQFALQLPVPQTRSLITDDEVTWTVPDRGPPDEQPARSLVRNAGSPAATSISRRVTTTVAPASPAVHIPPEMKGISLLARDDQSDALTQRTCPVTGDLLGHDGKPFKVQVSGDTVFVCCAECIRELKASPEKYLASDR